MANSDIIVTPVSGKADFDAFIDLAYRLNASDPAWVPRVGWFVWSGAVWAPDRDEIEVKRKCQLMGGLVKREVMQLRLGDRQMEQIARYRQRRTD